MSPSLTSAPTSLSYSSSIGFLSADSLPPDHPFAGTSTVEQRRQYWNSLPLYRGSSFISSVGRLSKSNFWTKSNGSSCKEPSIEDNQAVVSLHPSAPEQQKSMCGVASGIVDTLCCRPGAVTPATLPRVSRLPILARATLPAKFKLKTGRGKKIRALEDVRDQDQDIGEISPAEASLDSPAPTDRRVPTLSHQTKTLSSTGYILNSTPSSRTVTQPSVNIKSTTPPLHAPQSIQAPQASPSLNSLLRSTTLSDLPLRDEDTRDINNLLRDVARDRNTSYATWPRRRRSPHYEDPLPVILGESRAETVTRVRARLVQINGAAAKQVKMEREGERRGLTVPWSGELTRTRMSLRRKDGDVDRDGGRAYVFSSLRNVLSVEDLEDDEGKKEEIEEEILKDERYPFTLQEEYKRVSSHLPHTDGRVQIFRDAEGRFKTFRDV
jgi:hypothetical protein